MDFPVELVELLKLADVEGKKLTWNLQVIASAVSQVDLDQGCETHCHNWKG